MALKIGDLVKLKSGSAAMVVMRIDNDGVTCVWHTDKKEERTGTYRRRY